MLKLLFSRFDMFRFLICVESRKNGYIKIYDMDFGIKMEHKMPKKTIEHVEKTPFTDPSLLLMLNRVYRSLI
jgi:hypothetical protein